MRASFLHVPVRLVACLLCVLWPSCHPESWQGGGRIRSLAWCVGWGREGTRACGVGALGYVMPPPKVISLIVRSGARQPGLMGPLGRLWLT